MKYEKLFSGGQIGKMKTRNRLVMSPMGISLANVDGTPGDAMIAYYEARAIGGAGLIIPEITRVDDRTGAGELIQLSASQDYHIPGLARLAEAVHRHGTKIFIQLHHPGREGVCSLIGGQKVVSASAIMCKVSKQPTRALETEEVKEIIQEFIDAAVRVKKAGCDGVELHAAHGYLLQQFLSPYTNKRTDEYGGSFENRMRMITEIIQGIRAACGEDFPLGVRLSVDEFLDQTGVTEDYIHIQDGVKIAVCLEQLGIDFIDVSVGLYETGITAIEPISFPQGWRKDLIKAVKDHVHIPVIAVSAIREPEIAESFLENGIVDFVSLGRPWLADENWGVKAQEGRENEIRKCINCHFCFASLFANDLVGQPAECALNPRCAREKRYGPLKYDTQHHKVVVIGGGPSGMIAAETAAKRGMQVVLMDERETLGGNVNIAKLPPLKERMQWVADYYAQSLAALGVDVRLGVKADKETVLAGKPDAVIAATGSTELVPGSIPGIHRDNVYGVAETLTGRAGLTGKTVAVIGAGLTGLETAEYLAEQKNKVTVVDMVTTPAPGADSSNVIDVMGRLKKYGVNFALGQKLSSIGAESVVVESVANGNETEIPVDAVVISMGERPNHALADELKDAGIPVIVTGSAIKPGLIGPATRTGYEAARSLFIDDCRTKFRISPEQVKVFGSKNDMHDQEGVYIAYLTEPGAVARILPPPLKPFALPIVTVSVNHVNHPTFADDYYEAILGVYCTYGKMTGLYPISLLLGGNGAEMATYLGRDNGSIPKKLGAEFVIRRNGNTVNINVARRGTELVTAHMDIGRYNSYLTDAVFMNPAAGKNVKGAGFYFHFDHMPQADGPEKFTNGALVAMDCEYNYKAWEPAVTDLQLHSSIDDPWAELPIESVLGGAYCRNDLLIHGMKFLEAVDSETTVPYQLTAWYDQTAFLRTGRK